MNHGGAKEELDPPYARRHGHCTAKELKDLAGSAVWDNTPSFVVVRNPFTRIISIYKHRRGQDPHFNVTFSQWLVANLSDEVLFWGQQVDYILGGTPDEHRFLVESVFAFENGLEAVERFLAHKGNHQKIPTDINRGGGLPGDPKRCQDWYTDSATVSLVTRAFQDDFKELGYDPNPHSCHVGAKIADKTWS
mmetsp:Transcript_10350/g.21954  ORF Transcript_10350/g.21954 Transcript_10350/m.21954 type:complete len:192 (-) Transcript_10350:139-714(-)